MEKKALLDGSGRPSAPPGPDNQFPPEPNAPPPYPPGQRGYGGVVNNQPHPHMGNAQVGVKPPNYLILNVVTMIFCCFVCGLVGLLTATQVDTAWKAGDRETAMKHSRNAKKWGLGGILGGCVLHCFTITTLAITFGVMFGAQQYYNYSS